MTNNIANLYTSLTGVKQDFKLDWKEDAKADWKVDWAHGAPAVTPPGSAPVNTVPPGMTGTAKVGMPLFISNGTWTGVPAPTFTYAWSSSATGVIPDQTASEYLCQSTDVGNIISAIVTAHNESGDVSITVAAAPAIVA
jgi:hypothetical protein